MNVSKPTSQPEDNSFKLTRWIGSVPSLAIHTLIFALAFVFVFFGIDLETVLLVLTTAVSLEAIYLAIFIQMTVNRQSESIEEVEQDIGEIQEDIDEIQEDVEDMEKDLDVIQEDVDVISTDIDEISDPEKQDKGQILINNIRSDLQKLLQDVEKLQQRHDDKQTNS